MTKDKFDEPGYVRVTQLRKFWADSTKFDQHLRSIILLGNDAI